MQRVRKPCNTSPPWAMLRPNKQIEAIRSELLRRGKAAVIAVADAHGELIALLRLDGTPRRHPDRDEQSLDRGARRAGVP